MAASAGSGSGDGGDESEGGRDLDRVVFFSDAVFAIAMTVLALTLSLPAGTTDAGVASALHKAIPSMFSYALSFGVIASYWLAHHRMFRSIRRLDTTLLVLNLASLGAIAFVPFPTSVLGQHTNTTAAVVSYAATMGVLGALFSAFWMYATHDRQFIGPIRLPGSRTMLCGARSPFPPSSSRRCQSRSPTHTLQIALAHDRGCPSPAGPPIRQHLRPVKGHAQDLPFVIVVRTDAGLPDHAIRRCVVNHPGSLERVLPDGSRVPAAIRVRHFQASVNTFGDAIENAAPPPTPS